MDPPGSTDFTQLPKDSGVRIPSAVQPSLDLASLLPADKSYVTYSGGCLGSAHKRVRPHACRLERHNGMHHLRLTEPGRLAHGPLPARTPA